MAYYSGQGKLYVAERNADGTPKGFVALGNVPALELSVEVTKFEHKESMSGSRAVDLTIVQEKKGTFSMTMEDMDLDNLALAFWGEKASLATASISDLVVKAAVHATEERRVPIMNYSTGDVYPGISTVVVGDDATPSVTYEFGTSPGTTAVPGGSLNGWVDEDNGTLIIFSTAEQTARSASATIVDGQDLFIDAAGYSDQEIMHAFTETSQQRWLRFEGLNTIDNKVVVIDLFKADLDPLTGYGLINEELATFEITGSVLYDELQPGTSKFFRQVNAT